MNIKPSQVRSITESARAQLDAIIKKLESGLILTNTDVGMLGMNFNALREMDIAEAFRVNARTVRRWASEDGCPKRPDQLYDLLAVIEWYCERNSNQSPSTLSETKTQEEINVLKLRGEKLEMELAVAKESTIPKETHERVKTGMIESFTAYLRNTMLRNIALLRAVPDSEIEANVNTFIINLTKQMSSSATRAERV